MSTTVDERVVEMRFDNKQFEQNIQTSLSSLDKLKKSLNLEGAAKGLETVNDAANKCSGNMSPLSNAVETVRVRFSALEVMAITALQNITNSALAAGKNLVSAFTIDPIKTGFEEYETQINAVQTILANTSSKGTTLDQVNNALDELNHYADMTIYNFTEMTRNIGTFTAAGVDLDTSVAAIKGIANLAAVSGSNSQQASTAMYQLSQALAAGTVKLQDWNSVVNAGMGGQVFQDALKETAKVHGIAIDEMIKDEGSFRETLSKGWLTSDILTETLAKFTGDLNEDQLRTMGYTDDQIKSIMEMGKTANDAATKVKTFTQLFDTLKEAAQSGWTQSWEIIVGDFEEAKELLTEVSDTFSAVINASADARNKMLQDWKDLGGRTMMIEAVKNVFEGLVSVAKPVREAFNEIFPPMTGKQLAEITERIRDLTAKFKMGEESSKNLKNTFKGVFAVLDIVGQAFKAVAGGVGELIGLFLPAGNGVLSLTGSFGEYLVKLDETVKKTDVFGKAVSTVVDIVKIAITFVKTAGEKVKEFGKTAGEKFDFPGFELFHSFLERVHDRMAQIGDGAGKMKSGVIVAFEMMGEALEKCKFLKVMEALWTAVKVIAGGIADAVGTMMGTLAEKLGNADFSGVLDILNSIAVGGIAVSISKFLKSVTEPLEGLNGVLEGVTGILDGVRGCFEAYQTNLKAGTLLKIGAAIALLAGSIVAISLIDSDKLSASLGAITVLFANLLGAMAIFNKISSDTGKVSKACTAMIAMSVAVSILAGALKKVSDLDWGELARGLIGIAGLTTIVVASSKAMASGQKQVMKGATSLIIFGAAIKILASACKDLSKLQWDELGRGLTGVGVLFGEIAVFLRVAKFNGKMISTATGIVILAAAMKVLASACKDFGQMEWSEIGKGLAGIGGLLAELAVFTNLAGNAKHVMSTGVALTAIGAAMKIFASAVKDFAQLQWDELGRGLTAMGGALAEVAIAVNLMPKNMIGIGTGLVIVGGALEIIANCMSKFGGMQWEEIGRGLTVMGGALAELAISLNFMKGTLGGSAALLVASAALAVLAPVLSILGALSWEAIAKGLISIAGAFTIIGVAGAVLTPLVPTILALSGAFALIGVGVLTIGAGLLAAGTGLSALAIGFTALATAGAAGATAIVAALTVIVTGIASLIPAVLTKVGEGLIAICKVIAAGAPAIGEAVKSVILTLIDVFVSCVPQLADGALRLVVGVLEALVTYTPQIVDLAFKFLIGILEGIASNLPSLIKAGIDVLMAFFAGIVDALSGIDTGALLKGIAGIGLLSAIMLALSATAALVPGAMVGILGMGAVVAEMALVLAAVGLLSKLPGLSWLIGEGGKLLQGIGTAIGQFVGGIVGGFMSGVSSQFPQIGADLSAFMNNVQPFLQGASQIQPSMMDGVKALAETVLILTAADILQGLTSWLTGGSSLSKFGEELVPFGEAMRDFSLAIGNMDGEIVANAATAGKALAEMAAIIPNTGGLVSFFAGENDMTAFGKQLVPFGEAMKQFGDAITGLDSNAVTEAAIAGKAMAEMATTIPNSGGVVGFFAGENDMGEFGKQLVPFGEAMKAFGDAVRGLEADAIVNSATAGKALVELADTVPNTGGVVAFFTGNNDVNTFGEKLVPFGEAMKAYSEAIMGMDSAAVTNSATAGKALVELANTIPNTGGLVSWFTGDNDLGSFGDSLVQFGSGIKSYSDSISGIDTGIMSSVITQVNRLVEMAKGMAELDTSGMSGFSTALTQLGNNGIDSFINAFTDASGRVTSTATSMLTTFINAANAQKSNMTSTFTTMMQAVLTTLTNYQTQFNTAGSTLMTKFITGIKSQDGNTKTAITNIISGCVTAINNKQIQFNTAGSNLMIKLIAGIKSKDYETRNAFVNILSSCLTAIANKYPEFQNAGMQCMIKFIAGIKEKAEEVKTAFTGNLNASVTAIRDYHEQFKQAGAYLVEGFADGISENTYRAEAKARAMARAAAEAAEDELDEHSPSRVGYHIGDFFGLGFVNAIGTYAVKAYNASADMAKSAKTGLGNAIAKVKDMIDNGVDTQPTIRPILDLSDVEEKSHRLNTLFSRSQALTVSTGIAASRGQDLQNEDTNPNTGNSYNFTQNNYSPKALSRTEIYRQTKNQFSAMERMVET
ncbi:tape measure protein [Hungatella hathewayi]|jgi:tape measure domain-containing protein|uniref:Tape measure domain protein n=1 Tax=Hungatella hathewayi DSM 13479 TaxID=566550 RepID=D3AIK2_9FIRM|nr:tape measure protein [Hungatella hathewayi]EFC98372.1 tape measure domain protein [Hungatella hathewayi DSM 13479]UWO85561.1 tape measure protein [Hungatella hathewayi]